MSDNTVSFRLTVSGAPESAAAVEAAADRMRGALSKVTFNLDRNLGAMVGGGAGGPQAPETMDRYQAGLEGWRRAQQLAVDTGGQAYGAHLALAGATERARNAVQSATAPTGLWAKGISDAAAAALAGAPAHNALAMAFGRTESASRGFGDNLRASHQQLFEGARLTRSFVDALGGAIPGIAMTTGALTRLSRETQGFTVGEVAMTAGLLGAALVVGRLVEQTTQLITVQAAANKAVAGMDFSAAQAGLSGAIDKVRELTVANQTLAARSISSTGLAGIGAWYVKISASLADIPAQVRAWADAADKTWQSFGRGQAILDVVLADLTAQNKALDVAAAHASSLGALAGVYAEQEAAIRAAAKATLDKKILDDQAFEAARVNAIAEASDSLTQAQLEKMLSDLEEELAGRKKQRMAEGRAADAEAITRKDADAKKIAEFAAQEITDAGRLIEIKARLAKADADFFGTSLQGADVAALRARQATEIEAQRTRIGGLQGPERQAAQRELERMEAEHGLQITEARRTSYQRDIDLLAATYAHEEKLGEGSLAAKLDFLKRGALDENLSLEQRRHFAEEAHGQTLSTAQALLAIAGGEQSRLETERQLLQSLKDQEKSLREQGRLIQDNKDKRDKTRRELDEKDREIIARSGKPENLTPRQQQEREVAAAEQRIRDRAAEAQRQDEEDAKALAAMRDKAEEDRKRQAQSQITFADIPGLLDKARQRDEALLGGAPGTPGDIAGAMGREDFWKRVGAGALPAEISPVMPRPETGQGASGGAPSPPSTAELLTAMPKLGRDMEAFSTSFGTLVGKNQEMIGGLQVAVNEMRATVERALTATTLAQQLLDQYRATYGRR